MSIGLPEYRLAKNTAVTTKTIVRIARTMRTRMKVMSAPQPSRVQGALRSSQLHDISRHALGDHKTFTHTNRLCVLSTAHAQLGGRVRLRRSRNRHAVRLERSETYARSRQHSHQVSHRLAGLWGCPATAPHARWAAVP